ncbi:MAG: YchJ family protein [Deltaproteobacteria bacterium]|nr:YchJ family protein [Deltaproteobacteria bacterium]
MADCPCGTKKPMTDCCGLYLSKRSFAPTAEALMRSRYTAYTLADAAYLQRTSENVVFDAAATRKWSATVKWQGLEVLNVTAGTANEETGEVSYIARFREQGQARTIFENALFRKVRGEWLYIGPKSAPPDGGLSKVGRNDPCPCSAGKKFKNCCGKNI